MSTTNPTNITTEWDDAQVKYGNLAAPKVETTDAARQEATVNILEQIDPLADKSEIELEELGVEESVLEAYRRQRLGELQRRKRRQKFSTVFHISNESFKAQVTEASKERDADGAPQFVVCLLYKDAAMESAVLMKALKEFAAKHGDVKVCMGLAADIIPGFPDARVPATLIYHDGTCIDQLFGLAAFGGPQKTSGDSAEWLFAKKYKMVQTELTKNPCKTEQQQQERKKKTFFRLAGSLSGSDSEYDREDEHRRQRHTSSSDEDSGGQHGPTSRKDDRGYASTKLDSSIKFV